MRCGDTNFFPVNNIEEVKNKYPLPESVYIIVVVVVPTSRTR